MIDDVADRLPPALNAAASERMLHGLVSPDEAPTGYEGVARLVIAARRPPGPEEVAGTDAAVLAALMVLSERHRTASPLVERARRVRRLFRIKVTAVAFAGTMIGTSGLAAAGVLPDPIQHAAAQVLGTVGIDVPDPANHGAEVSETARTTDAQGREKGREISAIARTNGKSEEPHGKSEEPHGKSDEPHGKSDEPHGRSDDPHGNDGEHGRPDVPGSNGNGPSAEPNGRSDEPHGQPDDAGPDAPDPSAPTSEPPEGPAPTGPTGTAQPSDPGANGNGNGNGNDGANGNGNGGGPPA
jgi:hypothetical protein